MSSHNINESESKPQRLQSLDALRGFDMMWIIGGSVLLRAIAEWTGWPGFIQIADTHTRHTPWAGMTAWDLIFPLFVFMSGITMPYAITGKLEKGMAKRDAWRKLFTRMLWLVGFGWSFSLFKFQAAEFKPYTVLGLIGVAYFIAGGIVIHRNPRSQLLCAIGMLVGYWLAFIFIPVPGYGAGVITPTGNLGGYLDRNLIPGKLHMGIFDPEGTIRVIPAAAMALLGAATGNFLRSRKTPTLQNVFALAGAGIALILLGLLWNEVFPIIKPLWSSSYIVFSAGWSLLILAVFYLVIDVWRQSWIAFLFLPLGMNSITIYVAVHYFDFKYTAKYFFEGMGNLISPEAATTFVAAGVLLIEWLLLYFLYRKRIFLRV